MPDEHRRQFALDELAPLFATLERISSPCVLMGGQAACYWACTFLATEPALGELAALVPFLSKDVDFQGNRDAVIALARALGKRAEVPDFRNAFGNLMAGKIILNYPEGPLSVEVLRKVPGLAAGDLLRLSAMMRFRDHTIRVLNPVAMLMAKSWNVVNITKEGRHDTEQLYALVICVRAFLRLILSEGDDDNACLRGALKFIEQALRFTELPAGRRTAERCGVDWSQILPHTFIAAGTQPAVVRLREKRLPGWLAHLARYHRAVPVTETHRKLLTILARHAEPLCGDSTVPTSRSTPS